MMTVAGGAPIRHDSWDQEAITSGNLMEVSRLDVPVSRSNGQGERERYLRNSQTSNDRQKPKH